MKMLNQILAIAILFAMCDGLPAQQGPSGYGAMNGATMNRAPMNGGGYRQLNNGQMRPDMMRRGRDPRSQRAYYDTGPRMSDSSWTFVQAQQPRKYALHDMIYISVSETAQSSSEADVQRRKNAIYDGSLEEWVYMLSLFTIKPAPQRDGDISAKGQLNQTYRAEGDIESRESIQLKITAEVADILPNGNLVLEAHKRIRVNNAVFEVSLSGICDPEDIAWPTKSRKYS